MPNKTQDALNILREKARADGLRHTAQRDAVVECFFDCAGHVTAEELLAEVRRRHPETGFATVHRTLKLLCHYGLAEEMKIGKAKARYEAKLGRQHHDHLICLRCGSITEVHNAKIEELQNAMADKEGFKPTAHRLEIFGVCKKCR